MTSIVVVVAIALLSGIAVALQAQFMGTMERVAGTPGSVFITYGLGALLATLIWLVAGQPAATFRRIPAYSFFAGALGLVIVGGISYSAPRLGLSRTILLTIAAQLAAAVLIDHYALFAAPRRPLDTARVIGVALTIAGAWLVVRR